MHKKTNSIDGTRANSGGLANVRQDGRSPQRYESILVAMMVSSSQLATTVAPHRQEQPGLENTRTSFAIAIGLFYSEFETSDTLCRDDRLSICVGAREHATLALQFGILFRCTHASTMDTHLWST